MSEKQCKSEQDTQVATTRHSIDITDEMYKRYFGRHHGTEMYWDDSGRNNQARKKDSEKGFLAEATLVEILEQKIGEEHVDWQGDKGEADIQLFDTLNIEVKCRDTKTQRNLIIDEGKLDHSKVHLYINTVLHRDFLTDEPSSLEVLGHIMRKESLEKRTEIEGGMYWYADDEEKYEVHPRHLDDFADLIQVLCLYANDDPEDIIDIIEDMK